jgi:hypothetical protein
MGRAENKVTGGGELTPEFDVCGRQYRVACADYYTPAELVACHRPCGHVGGCQAEIPLIWVLGGYRIEAREVTHAAR